MKYKSIYWIVFYPFVNKFLSLHFEKSVVRDILKRAKNEYISLLAKADDIGEDNPMASNLYFALLFLSFHSSSPNLIDEFMMSDMIKFILTSKFILRLMNFDLNNKKHMEALRKRMVRADKWARANKDKYPETWQIVFDDSKRDGVFYYFTKCPIAKFFEDNGFSHLTHIFCETDYLTLSIRGGRLIRNHTIAEDKDYCDFWIVGDKVKDPK